MQVDYSKLKCHCYLSNFEQSAKPSFVWHLAREHSICSSILLPWFSYERCLVLPVSRWFRGILQSLEHHPTPWNCLANRGIWVWFCCRLVRWLYWPISLAKMTYLGRAPRAVIMCPWPLLLLFDRHLARWIRYLLSLTAWYPLTRWRRKALKSTRLSLLLQLIHRRMFVIGQPYSKVRFLSLWSNQRGSRKHHSSIFCHDTPVSRMFIADLAF